MNIYDEALKELQDYISEYGMDYYATKHFPKTIKAIKRAKKVEGLLQAYKELIDNTSAWKLDWDGHAKIEILEEEINLEEKELEEMK